MSLSGMMLDDVGRDFKTGQAALQSDHSVTLPRCQTKQESAEAETLQSEAVDCCFLKEQAVQLQKDSKQACSVAGAG